MRAKNGNDAETMEKKKIKNDDRNRQIEKNRNGALRGNIYEPLDVELNSKRLNKWLKENKSAARTKNADPAMYTYIFQATHRLDQIEIRAKPIDSNRMSMNKKRKTREGKNKNIVMNMTQGMWTCSWCTIVPTYRAFIWVVCFCCS